MVVFDHVGFPVGDGMWSASRDFAICSGVSPLRNAKKIRETMVACSGSISGSPFSPGRSSAWEQSQPHSLWRSGQVWTGSADRDLQHRTDDNHRLLLFPKHVRGGRIRPQSRW